MATYLNTVVRFHDSDMTLSADTNESYLTELEARIRAAGILFSGHIPSKCVWERVNGPIHESFQLQMGFLFPFLRANDLRSSLLIMRTRSFLLSCT